MAVKHKVLDYEDRPHPTPGEYMNVLLRTLEKFRNEPQTLPKGNDMVQLCDVIVGTLRVLVIPAEPSAIATFAQDIQSIQDFLEQICYMEEHREQLVYVVLKKLYNIISDPKDRQPSAALSVILNLVDPQRLPTVVKLILEEEQSDACLQQALLTLCYWMTYWSKTTNLGECILIFIRGLEYQERYDILMNVTLNVVDKIFNCLVLPAYRLTVGPLVLYMLSRMQDSPAAFHKIVPLVPYVTHRLKKENSLCSNGFAEDIVNMCKALSEHFPGHDTLYEILENAYACYPPSSVYRTYLNCVPWSNNIKNVIVLKPETDKVGLNNLGNTCYMNSVLQALFMTKYFSNNVLTQGYQLPLISKLQALFAMLQFSHQMSLSPKEILRAARPPGFIPGHQHDSSEFLGYLLDILHEECKLPMSNLIMPECAAPMLTNGEPLAVAFPSEYPSEYPVATVVQKAFGGRAETVYSCHACGAESVRADNFRELQLSFPSDFTEGEAVQTLLEYYLKPERLCGDNQYHCERCDGLADAEREFRVIQPPPRLVLTLKHFHYDSVSQQRMKLLHRVQYNATLKLANVTYELYAAVIHCGTSVDSGHYYTYAKDSNGWYKFNDSWVSTSPASDLYNLAPPETPYILFYSRQDCIEVEPISRNELPTNVEVLLRREMAALEAERRERHRVETNIQRIIKKDDPPPPGCGGGGGMQITTNGFVC